MLTTEEVPPTPLMAVPHQYAVKFFVEDADLYQTLARYVRQAVDAGQGVLVAATAEHWRGLMLRLSAHYLSTGDRPANDRSSDDRSSDDQSSDDQSTSGGQVEGLVERGQLVFVDAEEVRDELMVKGQPSHPHFEALFRARIDQLRQQWSGAQVYDETVDLLAQNSQFGPMRQLEKMWDGCRRDSGFGLLSGYRLGNFSEPADEAPFDNVCAARQQVIAAGESGGLEVAKWQRRTVVLNQRLNQKQHALDQACEELERERERNQCTSDFIGKFAHELRNPLAPLLCAVEMMNLRGDTTSERERGIIERQVSRMVGLVDDFMDATRVLFDRVELQPSQVETHDVVRQAVKLAEAAIEDGEHRLHVDVARSGLLLDADPNHLAQAVAELLENAATYMPKGGNIWVDAHREGNSVAISVRDDGPGVDPSLLEDIFEMFVQGDVDAQIGHRGMGLGLAIVRKIVESHDGVVTALSDKAGIESTQVNKTNGGVATAFVMRLPLAEPRGLGQEVSRMDKDEVGVGAKMLVVDDNEDFASMLCETLDLLGHDARIAHNAHDALAMLGEFWPDVAVLDLNLPDMSGHELAERIKQQSSARGGVRLVALTGYSDDGRRKQSQEMGFDAHLVKPIVLSQLQETLDSVLDD